MDDFHGCMAVIGVVGGSLLLIAAGFLFRIGWELVEHVNPLANWLELAGEIY